jgi:hypothetical protein
MKTTDPLRIGVLPGGFLVFLAVFAGCVTTYRTASAQPVIEPGGGGYVGVSVEAFHDALSPYGDWVYANNLGRVWRPYRVVVGADFRPYLTGGHWVYTDYGWTFESDYDWGWAPYHYGRWYLEPFYGWVWVPDTVWGPAWVDWRFGNGYVGWVPLPPPGISVTVNYYQPAWCFVHAHHFVVRDVDHHALPVGEFHQAYGMTNTVRGEIHHGGARWNAGPPPGQVSQVVGHPIQAVNIAPPPPGRIAQVHPAGSVGAAAPPAGQVHWARPPQENQNQNQNGNQPHLGARGGWTGQYSAPVPTPAPAPTPTPARTPTPIQTPRPVGPPPGMHSAPISPSPVQVQQPAHMSPPQYSVQTHGAQSGSSPVVHAAPPAAARPPAAATAPAPHYGAPPAGRASQQNQ